MATYITIETTDGVSIVRSVHPTAAAASAAAEKEAELTAVAVAVSDDVEPGWHFTAPDRVSPTGAPDVAANRREILRGAWLAAEQSFSPLWGDEALYKRRIILNCSAASVAANLNDNTLYEVLLTEASIPGDVWYLRHDATAWTSYAAGSASENYYSTNMEDGTGTLQADMALNLSSDFNWIAWLREDD